MSDAEKLREALMMLADETHYRAVELDETGYELLEEIVEKMRVLAATQGPVVFEGGAEGKP